MSAQRLKNNDLQNRITELNLELEKLRDENKTLKRVHHREEIALKKLETQDVDVSRMVRNHMEEASALKEIIKTIKNENRKLNNTLIDKDEEIRTTRKKYDELKKILKDKKLLDSAELSRKLEQCEKDLATYKTKNEVCYSYYLFVL
jgi:chromosome segregation ATPase